MDYAIRTNQITKTYAGQKAVDSVSIQVPAGSVYGYLGANGAGKTTTIRMLLSLIKAESGSIELLGKPVPADYNRIAPKIGIVPGEVLLYEELTGYEMLNYLQNFLKEPPVLRDQLINDFKFSQKDLHKKIRYYSQGMKQKILLIQAMQHNPDLLIFDEPSEKLDPLMQNVFYDYISLFKKQEKTIFLSSHNLPEVEKVCDQIGIIKDGKLLVQDKIDYLKKQLPRLIKIRFKDDINAEDFNRDFLTIVHSSQNKLEIKITGPLESLMDMLQKYRALRYRIALSKTFPLSRLANLCDTATLTPRFAFSPTVLRKARKVDRLLDITQTTMLTFLSSC